MNEREEKYKEDFFETEEQADAKLEFGVPARARTLEIFAQKFSAALKPTSIPKLAKEYQNILKCSGKRCLILGTRRRMWSLTAIAGELL